MNTQQAANRPLSLGTATTCSPHLVVPAKQGPANRTTNTNASCSWNSMHAHVQTICQLILLPVIKTQKKACCTKIEHNKQMNTYNTRLCLRNTAQNWSAM